MEGCMGVENGTKGVVLVSLGLPAAARVPRLRTGLGTLVVVHDVRRNGKVMDRERRKERNESNCETLGRFTTHVAIFIVAKRAKKERRVHPDSRWNRSTSSIR